MPSSHFIESSGLAFLQYANLCEPGLVHGVFNRHGGLSSPPFDFLNASFGVGDSDENVTRNRELIKKVLGVKTLASALQAHGNRVLDIRTKPETDMEVEGYDALITEHNIAIMVQQADCQAVLLYSPNPRVIGVAHAGWRGSVEGILDETVKTMVDSYGVDPGQIKAAISPSLGSCCAEFINFKDELPEWMHSYQVSPNHFDFHAISRAQLIVAGIKEGNISSASTCTRCNPDYFSYRRDKVTGRFASVIGLVR